MKHPVGFLSALAKVLSNPSEHPGFTRFVTEGCLRRAGHVVTCLCRGSKLANLMLMFLLSDVVHF